LTVFQFVGVFITIVGVAFVVRGGTDRASLKKPVEELDFATESKRHK
jgi:hypothetical protein